MVAEIGIIIPPPEVRNIVKTTAAFVARNGIEFESRIRQSEAKNAKFNFLNPNDPYHAYYQHEVKQNSETETTEQGAPGTTTDALAGTAAIVSGLNTRLAQETPRQVQEVFEPKDPPPEFEFSADPPSINSLELDIVKLTAQFVARNGRQFLTNLMQREARNYLFDFLKTQHSMFGYFTKLVEQYTKILIPSKDLLDRLDKEANDPREVYKQIKYRVDWQKYQDRQRKREEEILDRERLSYAQIDWHDFVVVETVDYQPNERGDFPPPTIPEEVGARVLAEERGETLPKARRWRHEADAPEEDSESSYSGSSETESDDEERKPGDKEGDGDDKVNGEDNRSIPSPSASIDDAATPPDLGNLDARPDAEAARVSAPVDPASGTAKPHTEQPDETDMEIDDAEDMEMSDDEGGEVAPPPSYNEAQKMPPPPAMPELGKMPDNLLIRKGYDPKTAQAARQAAKDTVFLKSPFGDQFVPVNQAESHIHIGLLDPSWVEQRDRDRRPKQSTHDMGAHLEQNLKYFAERRTDIFGSEETRIGQKLMSGAKRMQPGESGSKKPSEEVVQPVPDVAIAEPKEVGDGQKIGPHIVLADRVKAAVAPGLTATLQRPGAMAGGITVPPPPPLAPPRMAPPPMTTVPPPPMGMLPTGLVPPPPPGTAPPGMVPSMGVFPPPPPAMLIPPGVPAGGLAFPPPPPGQGAPGEQPDMDPAMLAKRQKLQQSE